ncbi:methyl-accepting chemotaxis protein, partial [Haliangium sp.]|uniref:methyl-accepting chemotaxis protein n=1 Tax=Haliangium sp. TaxID=2663208 RepID=UPI003D0CC133
PLYNLVLSVVIAAAPLLLMRLTGSIDAASNVMLGLIAALMAGLAAMLGGIAAPNLPILTLCPIMAVLLVSRRAALLWALVAATIVAALYGVERVLDHPVPQHIDGDTLGLLRAAGLCVMFILAIVVVYLYNASQERALAMVRTANRRLTTMIAHLDATSTALGRSAAEFLGSEVDGAQSMGLTQQMQTMAGSSRTMIHRVQRSIRGMIEQYKQISARVAQLHEQSGIIADMVQTIDNISDRLDLMALNTGIEAAHAGPAGARFKLLAEDMRRLAERVLDETARIKTSIREVQGNTSAATAASLTGQALTDEGGAQLEAMAGAFDEMYDLIEHTADASRRITVETMSQIGTIHALIQTALHGGERGEDTERDHDRAGERDADSASARAAALTAGGRSRTSPR